MPTFPAAGGLRGEGEMRTPQPPHWALCRKESGSGSGGAPDAKRFTVHAPHPQIVVDFYGQ